jgi:nicotinamidase-related amidase
MTTTTPKIDCKKSALLVMDYQPAILGMLPKSDELLTRAAAAISMARDRGVQIGYVRVAFDDSDYAAIPDTNKMFSAVASSRRMPNEAPETAVHKQLAPQAGDIVVRKTRVGAFSTTDLEQQLRRRGITNLILAGISTSGVVLSTLRDAADRDYRVYVLADGTADLDPEVHDILIKKIFPRQAYIITTTELADLLSAA